MSTNSNQQEDRVYLLKIQVGPVQDFIAQARSTRDLWSGSYLLSWLMAAGIREARRGQETEIIFPCPDEQLILGELDSLKNKNSKTLLISNLPNLFVARTSSSNPRDLANDIDTAIREEWLEIANSVWTEHKHLDLPGESESLFRAQVERHLKISWMITPESGDYAEAYRENGWRLNAVRQTNSF